MMEIVNWPPRKKHLWKKNNWNKIYSIQKNAFEHVVCKMAAICLGLKLASICKQIWVHPDIYWDRSYFMKINFFVIFIFRGGGGGGGGG